MIPGIYAKPTGGVSPIDASPTEPVVVPLGHPHCERCSWRLVFDPMTRKPCGQELSVVAGNCEQHLHLKR